MFQIGVFDLGLQSMGMRMFLRFVAVLIAAASLGGCVTSKKLAVPFDRQSTSVHRIGILDPQFPEDAMVSVAVSAGRSFGLIGALVDIGAQVDRETRFGAELERQSFRGKDMFVTNLRQAIEAEGYETVLVSLPRPENGGYVATYPAANEHDVDAYLDIVVSAYGYMAASSSQSTPYRPATQVHARLVSAEGQTLLMEDGVYYNPFNPMRLAGTVVTLSPDRAYAFATFDDLMAEGEKASEGLGKALEATSTAMAGLLR